MRSLAQASAITKAFVGLVIITLLALIVVTQMPRFEGEALVRGASTTSEKNNEETGRPAKRAKETDSLLLPGQKATGYEATVIQMAKPLECALKSYWRGDTEEGPSVEQRLDDSLRAKDSWATEVNRAVEYCGNGSPMMAQNEFGFLYHLLRPGDLMLEWGSGVSSCVWAYKVGELHSIEDNAEWAMKSRATLTRLENQVLHFLPPVEPTRWST